MKGPLQRQIVFIVWSIFRHLLTPQFLLIIYRVGRESERLII